MTATSSGEGTTTVSSPETTATVTLEDIVRDLAVAIELTASGCVHELGANLVSDILGLTTAAVAKSRGPVTPLIPGDPIAAPGGGE